MLHNNSHYISDQEYKYFEDQFEERKEVKEDIIAFTELKEVTHQYFKNFNYSEIIDKRKKKLREKSSSDSPDLFMSNFIILKNING
jgi:hypothetical protein